MADMSSSFPSCVSMETEPTKPELVPTEVFRCGKCGAVLFRKDQLLIHKPFEHKLAFEKTKRDKHPAHGCLSYFLKACPPWVKHQDQIEAKIYCPNCSTRLGMLKWQGEQCSCGTWISPAIQFPMSKVDLKVILLPVRRQEPTSVNEEKES